MPFIMKEDRNPSYSTSSLLKSFVREFLKEKYLERIIEILLNIVIIKYIFGGRIRPFAFVDRSIAQGSFEKAQAEFLDWRPKWHECDELSHRSKEFDDIIKEAESLLRELAIPDNYRAFLCRGFYPV